MLNNIKEIISYKEMIASLVRQNLRTRYKGSILGFLWTFVSPLLQLVVYTVIFSVVMRIDIDNFAMYLFVGLIPWLFFSSSIAEGSTCIVSNGNLIKKIYFPRAVLPIAVVLSGFMNMIFGFVVVLVMLLVTGIGFSLSMIYLPVVLFVELLLCLSISLWISSMNVYLRDIEHVLTIVIIAWFYLTPIVYTVEMIPNEYLSLFKLNPMYSVIVEYRNILFFQMDLNFRSLVYPTVLGIILLLSGLIVFEKLQRNFAEEI